MKQILAAGAVSVLVVLGAQQATAQSPRANPPDDTVRAVIEKFHAIRPDEKQLAVYGLDWAPTLKDAKVRSAKEHRPIFLIFVTNSFGNIYTGHC